MDKESKRIGVISSQDHEEFFNDALAERLNDVDGCEGGLIDRLNYYHDVNVRTVIVDDDILAGRPDAEDALVNWIKTVTAPKVNIILFVDEARDEEDPFLYRLVSDAGVTDIMIAGNEGDPKRRLLEIIDNGMTLAEYGRWKTDEKPWEAKKKGVFGRLKLGGKKKAEKKSSKKDKKAKSKKKETASAEPEEAFEESSAEETESDLLDEVYEEKREETAEVNEAEEEGRTAGDAGKEGADGTQAAEPGSLYDLDFDDLDLPSENAEKAATEGKNEAEETKPLDLSQLMLGTDPALPKVPVEAPRAPETATEGTVPTFAGATQEDIDAMVAKSLVRIAFGDKVGDVTELVKKELSGAEGTVKAGAFEVEHEEHVSKLAESEAKLESEFPEREKPEEDDAEEPVQAKSDKTDSNDGIASGEPETATDDEQEKLDELEKLLEGRFTRTDEPAGEGGEREAETPDDAQNEKHAENGKGAELGAEASDEETTEAAEAGNVDEANVEGPNGNPENEAECESNEASQEADAGENAADPVDETNTAAPEAAGEEGMGTAVEGATEPETEPHDGEADAQSAEPGEQIALEKGGTKGSPAPADNVERAVILDAGNEGLIELLNQIRNQDDGRRNNDKVMLPKAHDKILAVASTANGLGCTALSLHLANELADLGMTVAVAMASKRDLNRMVAGMSEEMQAVHECGHRWRGFDVYFWDDEREFGDEYEVVVADCGKLDLTDTTPNSPANLFLNKADQKVLLFGGAPWILQAPLELMQRISRKQAGSWLLAAREVERNVQREFKTLLDTWFTDAEPHVWEVPNRPRFFQDEKGFGDYKPAIDKVLSEDARKRVRESEKGKNFKKKK